MTTPEELRSLAETLGLYSHGDEFQAVVDEVQSALRAYADSKERAEPSTQWRQIGSAPWWDGVPDESDGGGPYETRTIYLHPPRTEPPKMTEAEIEDWKSKAVALWMLLDDIDTQDDASKGNDLHFRNSARAIQQKRWALIDGPTIDAARACATSNGGAND